MNHRGYPSRHAKTVSLPRKWHSERHRRCFESAWQALNEKPGAIVALLGPRGHGKTVLAGILADRWSRQNGSALWQYSVLGLLLDEEKHRIRHKLPDRPIDDARSQPLLILDEIQGRMHSDWEDQTYGALVAGRSDELRPTIVVGCIDSQQIIDYSHAVASRMQDVGLIVECNWGDLRALGGLA